MNDEFYIGWEKKPTPGIAKTMRKTVLLVLSFALLVPLALAVSQHLIGASVFEWGKTKSVTGILQAKPYPHLLVPRPGKVGAQPAFSTYYLVMTWKFGINPEAIASLDGKSVTIKGTLIYRENQTMLETKPEWMVASTNVLPQPPNAATYRHFPHQTFTGEIVDSKCYLGVMNPGQLATHRACAIRCISGGCPPILVVQRTNMPAGYLLLVSADGKPVNKEVLDMVAEPVQIIGDVEQQGDLLILRADPATYRRLN